MHFAVCFSCVPGMFLGSFLSECLLFLFHHGPSFLPHFLYCSVSSPFWLFRLFPWYYFLVWLFLSCSAMFRPFQLFLMFSFVFWLSSFPSFLFLLLLYVPLSIIFPPNLCFILITDDHPGGSPGAFFCATGSTDTCSTALGLTGRAKPSYLRGILQPKHLVWSVSRFLSKWNPSCPVRVFCYYDYSMLWHYLNHFCVGNFRTTSGIRI